MHHAYYQQSLPSVLSYCLPGIRKQVNMYKKFRFSNLSNGLFEYLWLLLKHNLFVSPPFITVLLYNCKCFNSIQISEGNSKMPTFLTTYLHHPLVYHRGRQSPGPNAARKLRRSGRGGSSL